MSLINQSFEIRFPTDLECWFEGLGQSAYRLESIHDLNFRLDIQNKVHAILKTDIIESSESE